ncbi:glutathione S-transferase C-terminal domain-containing protein [Phyllobacterium sp. YR531]|uniref:glutathione S-transferase C-terminal domain-containing protein n=1 Tax=Phyllobacterium sp. YR531 TaxID=1144343 RepID=UPI00026FC3DC|nr:glutathione S-transferase C-terminal domain-containing protein [Phyllobacterium sp. YR531]EJN02390.1 glutathione S-transferase [Phyllobacterium sp. YR531]
MRYFYSPDTCALAGHIALAEAGHEPELIKVDVFTRTINEPGDYNNVNPKGYVPLLEFDDGRKLTENVAILRWISKNSERFSKSPPDDDRLTETLAFISSEIQKPFVFSFFLPGDEAKKDLSEMVAGRFAYLTQVHDKKFLLGNDFSVADAFLYVMLRWARMVNMEVSTRLLEYRDTIEQLPSVQRALQEEGLAT